MRLSLATGMTAIALIVASALVGWRIGRNPNAAEIVMLKEEACGCCDRWAEELRRRGYVVRVREIGVMDHERIRETVGIDPSLTACHVALIGNYILEGHVPPDAVARLLQERPDIVGLAVAGMPAGSLGMEGFASAEAYDVVAVGRDGTTQPYARYKGIRRIE